MNSSSIGFSIPLELSVTVRKECRWVFSKALAPNARMVKDYLGIPESILISGIANSVPFLTSSKT